MKTFYIHTFGCKVNQYETQLISDKLNKEEMTRVLKPEDAELIIFNSCTVTAEADKECEYFLRKISKISTVKKIVLTGCFAINKKNYLREKFPNIEIVTKKDELFTDPKNQIIQNFYKRSRAFVKVQDGCNSFCSYCIVPFVRNKLWSKPEEAVISEIKNLVKNGYCEIVLTGIHVGKYDKGISYLVKKIVEIPLEFRIRISSIEMNEINNELLDIMKDYPDKICRHFHIPLQSGSDEILKSMDRHYLTKDFEKKVETIISLFPDAALTSDVITGFPGEKSKHHKETYDFINKLPFAGLHIFRYSDRPGTKASSFEDKVSPLEIKKRSQELFTIDAQKRKNFIDKNSGIIRKAVAIGKNQALTDNYISVKTQDCREGIFEITITPETSSI